MAEHRLVANSCRRPGSGPAPARSQCGGDRRRHRLLGAAVSEEGHRVTTLELYFDLAFVFAFTQVSRLMAHHHDALGVLQAFVVLALLWWSWTAFGWLGNLVHADEGVVRVAMFVAMTAVFVGALAVPEAYHAAGGEMFAPLVFVGAYLVARITHAVLFAAVEDTRLRRRVVVTECASIVPAGVLLAIGAVVGSPWQVWCWLAAVAIEPLVSYIASRGVEYRVYSALHFTERYGLVVILALGESVIAIGVGVTAEPLSAPILGGVLLAILISFGMWWAYFAGIAGEAEHTVARLRGSHRARVATDAYTYLHLMLVAGIVVAALGVEGAMEHVADVAPMGLFGSATLAGGIACYLAGTALFARRVVGGWHVPRLAAAMLLLAAIPAIAGVPPIAALAIVGSVLIAGLVVDSRSSSVAILPMH